MELSIKKLNMADNSGGRPPLRRQRKPGEGPNPNGDFDWSKIIRSVFSWGAVIVLAVIVLQLLRSGSSGATEVPYNVYENFHNLLSDICMYVCRAYV